MNAAAGYAVLFKDILGNCKGKRVLEIGCGDGDGVNTLQNMGADVNCIDAGSKHVSPTHKTGSATELLKFFQPGSFDTVVALAFFGSPLAKWCVENGKDLRKTELAVLGQIKGLMKTGGLLLVYNADAWLPHLSTLRHEDYEKTGFAVVKNIRNDTLLLRRE